MGQIEVFQDCFDCRDLLFEGGVAHVDDVKQKIRFVEFLKGGPECRNEFFREMPYEADRVGDNGLRITGKAESRAFRVQRGEEEILSEDAAVRESVQECRLSRVGVAHDRYDRKIHPLSPAPSLCPSFPDRGEVFVETIDSFPHPPPVDFQFHFPRSPSADAAGEPRQC